MYMVPLMFMGMFMHVHACSCMLNSGCPSKTDVAEWRELKWEILDEFDRDASGNSIRSLITTRSKSAIALFARVCSNNACKNVIFHKDNTVTKILDRVHKLPMSN